MNEVCNELLCKINVKLIEYSIYLKYTIKLHVLQFYKWYYFSASKIECNKTVH